MIESNIVISCVAVIGVIITGVGQIKTWKRNGSQQAERDKDFSSKQAARDAVLNRNQQAIIERLDDKESGLQSVNNKVAAMRQHCAELSGPLMERVTNHDRELRDLKTKH